MIYITQQGIEAAKILNQLKTEKIKKDINKLTQSQKNEINRLINTRGFNLFLKDPNIKLLDIDVYDFYNISVRTKAHDIKQRKKHHSWIEQSS